MRIGGTSVVALCLGHDFVICALGEVRGNQRIVRKIARFDAGGPLFDRPEANGRALSQFLRDHQFDATRAVVGVPAKWVIAQEKELPPVSPVEALSILRLQAERMAMGDAGTLLTDTAGDIQSAEGRVLLVGMLKTQAENIQKLADAAGLNLIGICPTSLATSALIESDHDLIRVGESGAELVQWRSGMARLLRPMPVNHEKDLVLETRRVLAIRGQTGRLKLYDPRGLTSDEQNILCKDLGSEVELLTPDELNIRIDTSAMNGSAEVLGRIGYLPAAALSLLALDPRRLPVNFLQGRLAPPRQRRFGRTAYLAAAALFVVVVGLISLVMFVHARESEEMELNERLKSIAKDVKEAQTRLDQFRFGRQYFESRSGYLNCWRELSQTFNYSETIWVTGFVLRSSGEGQLMGKSTDQRLILSLRDRLMNNKFFSRVQLLDLRESSGRNNEITWSISFVYSHAEAGK
ncbi:MAG: hypothetical protein KatS3mg104_1935 [Phycisphaerae bacterium]|jgi:hypothetical protein|nr:MAG: hypothetical protein KatS3mg104_1935 [Phycisphaerae bacterium]